MYSRLDSLLYISLAGPAESQSANGANSRRLDSLLYNAMKSSFAKQEGNVIRAWQRRFASGQATVEMAMLAPLFLTMIFAIIEIGRFWGTRHTIAGAVREGARVMLLPYGPGTQYDGLDKVKTAAIKATQDYLDAAGLANQPPIAEIQAAWINPSSKLLDLELPQDVSRGDKVGVKISYKFETPLKVLLAGGDGVMMIEQACVLDHE